MTDALVALGIKDRDELNLKIREGKLTIKDVAERVGPPAEVLAKPEKLPVPADITPKQQAALEKLPKIFGKVVPKTKRLLTIAEIQKVYEERKTLDTIEKMLKDRKVDIRTTVVNHLDTDRSGEWPTDKEGHFLVASTVEVDGSDEAFVWEIQEGKPTFIAEDLKRMDESGEIDHDLYLRLTDSVRVVNEQKVLLELAKDPEMITDLIRKASSAGTTIGKLNLRKQKS